jgi:hypothetical protein
MSDWRHTLDRFEQGEAERGDLEGLLGEPDLAPTARVALRRALRIASGLRALLAVDPPPPPQGPLGEAPGEAGGDEGEHEAGLAQLFAGFPSAEELAADLDLSKKPAGEGATSSELLAFLDGLGAASPEAFGCEHSAPPRDVVSCQALADAIAACGASEATLWKLSEDGDLVGVANRRLDGGRWEELEGLRVPLAASAIGQVAQAGVAQSFVVQDYQDPIASWTTGVEVRAMLAAPVNVDGRAWGVISAVNPMGRESFSEEDLTLLRWKAYQLGLVLAACGVPWQAGD